jgi:hypothetical protein
VPVTWGLAVRWVEPGVQGGLRELELEELGAGRRRSG